MNSGIYTLVFSATHGMLVAVVEKVFVRGCRTRSRAARLRRTMKHGGAGLGPRRPANSATLAALCALGMQANSVEAQATLPMTPDRKGAAHPVIGVSASGIPLVNITAPNHAGVSINNFKQYNVGTKGAVIVNSGRHTQSQLAG